MRVEIKPGGAARTPGQEDFVLAWAIEVETRRPRYILELDAARNGAASGCICPGCGLPVLAINAGKPTWRRRPHFRHPPGAQRDRCLAIAARVAAETTLRRLERIELPGRTRHGRIKGLSGTFYDAWASRNRESVGIRRCDFIDEVTALMILDDGRRLKVRLVGRGEPSADRSGQENLTACIEIHADDPALAQMDPDAILARLQLVLADSCWVRHWDDADLDACAREAARARAEDSLDWMDGTDGVSGSDAVAHRETMLHREVKAVLQRERQIRVPGWTITAEWKRADGSTDRRARSAPGEILRLETVDLEVRLDHTVPDVVATWREHGTVRTLLIEVTVTNAITDERAARLESLGLPVLEIDMRRLGGTVTRAEFARLVLDEIAAKRWICHPKRDEEKRRLVEEMREADERETARAKARRAHAIPGDRGESPSTSVRGEVQRPHARGDAALVFVGFDPFTSHPSFADPELRDMLRAASEAARQNRSPWAFAYTYSNDGEPGANRILDRLKAVRLAATRWEWVWEFSVDWVCAWKPPREPA